VHTIGEAKLVFLIAVLTIYRRRGSREACSERSEKSRRCHFNPDYFKGMLLL